MLKPIEHSKINPSRNELRCHHCTVNGKDRWKHKTAQCYHLARLTTSEVRDYISNNNLCFSCMEPGHRYRNCLAKAVCLKCKQTHPSVMHSKYEAKVTNAPNQDAKGASSNEVKTDTELKICNTATSYSPAHMQEPQMMSMTVPV